jgi:uncharacterized membrane protein YjdF
VNITALIPSDKTKRRISRFLQFILLGILLFGLYRRHVGTIVNAAFSLAITFLPAFLEHDKDIPMNPGITFLMTIAVAMHAIGALGPYKMFWWWDRVLHTFSSFVVAAVGYAAVKAFDQYSDDIYFPPRFIFAFILLFTMGLGVLWEVFEFFARRASYFAGVDAVLGQAGLHDTLIDLVVNTLGGLIFAVWGTIYFNDYVHRLVEKLHSKRA